MGDHHYARMRPDETYLSSGWHNAMVLINMGGEASKLLSIFRDDVFVSTTVTSPNAGYQLKLGEGPSSVDNEWAGFTLIHYVVKRNYSGQLAKEGAHHYIDVLRQAGCSTNLLDLNNRRAIDHDVEGRFPNLVPEEEDLIESCSCFQCVPPTEYASHDGLRAM